MEYQALYRRYRPRRFDQIIGQDHITDVLKNQIATNQVSHAYLFSGSRGTGKTSTAKIFARAVNCEHPAGGEPCFECASCLDSMDDNVDIIELDAASNNRVDDIRALIEKAVFTPVKLQKKVYIIDEAHMLTQQAFNALLKTLEEPPGHVLFILATTEPQKILPTIASRCQRFDFRKLNAGDIVSCLEDVLAQAGAVIDRDGLISIAQKAGGGMRDAFSLADQCISLCGNQVSAADVHRVLGNVDGELLFGFADAIINSDAKSALSILDQVCAGRDVALFLQDVTAHFRALLIAGVCDESGAAGILDCTQEDMARFKEQANSTNQHRVMRVIDIFTSAQGKLRLFQNPRPLVEVETLRALKPEVETSVEALLDRLAVLEARPFRTASNETERAARKKPDETLPLSTDSKNDSRLKSDKTPAPDNSSKPVKTDKASARIIFDDITAKLEEKLGGGVGTFAKIVFKKAVDVDISGSVLNICFPDRTHYEGAQKYRAELENILLAQGHKLTVSIAIKDDKKTEDMETWVKDAFDDVKIVD